MEKQRKYEKEYLWDLTCSCGRYLDGNAPPILDDLTVQTHLGQETGYCLGTLINTNFLVNITDRYNLATIYQLLQIQYIDIIMLTVSNLQDSIQLCHPAIQFLLVQP